MIHVRIDPELARARYGLAGELAARAASQAIGDVLEKAAPSSGSSAVGDVVLGVAIAAAVGALAYLGHRSKGRRR